MFSGRAAADNETDHRQYAGRWWDGRLRVAQLTKLLGDVALAEFVVLAVFAFWQWRRSRIRGAGWAALSFFFLAGIGLVSKGMRLGWITPDQVLLKVLVGVLLLVPYAFYRFAAAFDRPPRSIRACFTTGGVFRDAHDRCSHARRPAQVRSPISRRPRPVPNVPGAAAGHGLRGTG